MSKAQSSLKSLPKTPTGILGLDDITDGGLPAGRPTLVAGNAGCGKTLLSMEFLVNGIQEYGENGVFITFEETTEDLVQNVASLGHDLKSLIAKKKLYIDHVQVDRSEIEETGEYDLEGLFIRLNYAIDKVGAKRVVLDTIESLFAGFENAAVLRAELRRLFQWLKEKGVTAVITAERGETTLTRQGMEEYVSDCVILLDHRVERQTSTRRLRIVKYRGSTHGTNEYPFLIDSDGITVMPITSLRLDHTVSSRRVSSGIPKLDTMLGGGYYEGSNILLTGTAGTGKTNVAVYMVDAACKRGEKALFIAFEESPQQIIRNAHSIGIDLARHVKEGLLQFEATRSSSQGLEMHLAIFFKIIRQFEPSVVVVDPITNMVMTGNTYDVRAMLGRMMDLFKSKHITAMFTSLTQGGSALEQTEFGVSSFVDTWLLLRDYEQNGERNRLIYVLKSRGTGHSNQVREFIITDKGIEVVNVYLGDKGMFIGSARVGAEARDRTKELKRQYDLAYKKRQLEHERMVTKAKLKSYTAELEMQETELQNLLAAESKRNTSIIAEKVAMETSRNGKPKITKNRNKHGA